MSGSDRSLLERMGPGFGVGGDLESSLEDHFRAALWSLRSSEALTPWRRSVSSVSRPAGESGASVSHAGEISKAWGARSSVSASSVSQGGAGSPGAPEIAALARRIEAAALRADPRLASAECRLQDRAVGCVVRGGIDLVTVDGHSLRASFSLSYEGRPRVRTDDAQY